MRRARKALRTSRAKRGGSRNESSVACALFSASAAASSASSGSITPPDADPVSPSSRRARPSEILVSGRRHSAESIRPCRHSRCLIGIGLASANSSGTSGRERRPGGAGAGDIVVGEAASDLAEAPGHDVARGEDAAVGAVGQHGEIERVLAGQHREALRACAPAGRATGRGCRNCPSRRRCSAPRRARAASRWRGSPPCGRGCCRSTPRGRSPRRSP